MKTRSKIQEIRKAIQEKHRKIEQQKKRTEYIYNIQMMKDVGLPLSLDHPEENLKQYAKRAFASNFSEIYALISESSPMATEFREEVLVCLLGEKVDDKMIILLTALQNWPSKNLTFNTENLDEKSIKIFMDFLDIDNSKHKKYKIHSKRRKYVDHPTFDQKFRIQNYREKLKIKKMKPFILYLLMLIQNQDSCSHARHNEIIGLVLDLYEYQTLHNPLSKFLSNLVLINSIGFADENMLRGILMKLMDCLVLEDIGTNTPFNKKSSEFDLEIFDLKSNDSLDLADLDKIWVTSLQKGQKTLIKMEILDLIFQEKNQKNFEKNQEMYFLSTHHLFLYCLFTLGSLDEFPGGVQQYFRYSMSFIRVFKGLTKLEIHKKTLNFKETIKFGQNEEMLIETLKEVNYCEEGFKSLYLFYQKEEEIEENIEKGDQFVRLMTRVILAQPYAQISLRVYCWFVSLIRHKDTWALGLRQLMKRIKVLEVPPCKLKFLRKFFKGIFFKFSNKKLTRYFIEEADFSKRSTQSQENKETGPVQMVSKKVDEPPILFIDQKIEKGFYRIFYLKKKLKVFELELKESKLSQESSCLTPNKGHSGALCYTIHPVASKVKKAKKFKSDHNIFIRNSNIKNSFFTGIFKKNENFLPLNFGSKMSNNCLNYSDYPPKNPNGGKLVYWAPKEPNLHHKKSHKNLEYFDYVCFFDTNFEEFNPTFTHYLERVFIRIDKRSKKRLISAPLTTNQGPNSLYIGRDKIPYRIFVSDNFSDFQNNKQLDIYDLRDQKLSSNSIGTLKFYQDENKLDEKGFINGFMIVHNWILIERNSFTEIYEVVAGFLIKRLEVPLTENSFFKVISEDRMIFSKIEVVQGKENEEVEEYLMWIKGYVIDFQNFELRYFEFEKEFWDEGAGMGYWWYEYIIDVYEDVEEEEVLVLYNFRHQLEAVLLKYC